MIDPRDIELYTTQPERDYAEGMSSDYIRLKDVEEAMLAQKYSASCVDIWFDDLQQCYRFHCYITHLDKYRYNF